MRRMTGVRALWGLILDRDACLVFMKVVNAMQFDALACLCPYPVLLPTRSRSLVGAYGHVTGMPNLDEW